MSTLKFADAHIDRQKRCPSLDPTRPAPATSEPHIAAGLATPLRPPIHQYPTGRPARVEMSSGMSPAASLLKRQIKEIQTSKDLPGISCGLVNDSNMFEWEVMLMINDDCKYYGGNFEPLLQFLRVGVLTDTSRWQLPSSTRLPANVSAHAALAHLPRAYTVSSEHLPQRRAVHFYSTSASRRRVRLRGRVRALEPSAEPRDHPPEYPQLVPQPQHGKSGQCRSGTNAT